MAKPDDSVTLAQLVREMRTGARKGTSACKAQRKAKTTKSNPARRQINRWKDDIVVCPMCLAHPWGRGRISNCREHIARDACPVLLSKLYHVASDDGKSKTDLSPPSSIFSDDI